MPGFFEAETEDWQQIWEINVQSHIHAAKHVLPQMLEREEGYLVNTSSAAGLLTQLGAAAQGGCQERGECDGPPDGQL